VVDFADPVPYLRIILNLVFDDANYQKMRITL